MHPQRSRQQGYQTGVMKGATDRNQRQLAVELEILYTYELHAAAMKGALLNWFTMAIRYVEYWEPCRNFRRTLPCLLADWKLEAIPAQDPPSTRCKASIASIGHECDDYPHRRNVYHLSIPIYSTNQLSLVPLKRPHRTACGEISQG